MQRLINTEKCIDLDNLTKIEIDLDKERTRFIIRNKLRKSAGTKRLGVLWLILDPVAMSLVYLFVLSVVRSYPNFESLFIGVSMYRLFQSSFMSGVGSISNFSGGIICERIRSRVLFHAAIKYRAIESLIQSSGISVILFLFLGVSLDAVIIFIIISLLMGVVAEGLGFNLSKLVRRIPDVNNIIKYFMLLMFFGSPVLYPMAITSGLHYKINEYNPFSYFVETVRYYADLESVILDFSPTLLSIIILMTLLLSFRGYYQIDRLRWEVSSWS